MIIRVAIFDNNKRFRNSITKILRTAPSIEVTGVYSDTSNCVNDVLASAPDIVLIDIDMPETSGIEAIRLLKKEVPHVQILIQTVFEDDDRVFDSICAGASGYILKDHLSTRLISAIQELQTGGSPMSPSIARRVLNLLQRSVMLKPERNIDNYNLTAREKEVLTCIVNGMSYKMVSSELNISYETVRSHVKKIYEKLHVASLTEAVALAIHQGLV
ncbi:response regulator [Chitinophaga rhizophila]|uniref:Response regulator transcription factor n=1 Tax=Chitinophaga rhizophila TaxID=2866212 RepID=A0ABS7GH60_9BACT|nr:response regulator transcription factor [Chitinophaga rhizophila]MBW8687022.1 response regulator transcription factor [Chitinophaga rhizophila]